MSLLSSVDSGRSVGPQIHVVTGDNGVGKTTFAASFPNHLILDLENGSKHLNANRLGTDKIPDLAGFRSVLNELRDSTHSYKTIAIDSAEALESIISKSVCIDGKVVSIEDYGGGYGKGYQRTREIMTEIMRDLQVLRDTKGITSIIVAHTQVKQKTDPAQNQTYDRVIMRCNDKMAAIIRDLADNVFYATYKVFTETKNQKTRAFGDGQRVMFTQWRPGFDAKNRLELPLEIPFSYDAFVEACSAEPTNQAIDIVAEINAIAGSLDEKMKSAVAEQIEKFKGNPAKLKEIKNRLMKYTAA